MGGLGWSSDGRFIAVGTTAGVHIHASDNLEKLLVLDESIYVKDIAWSNTDLRIAYENHETQNIYIYDAATGQRSELRAAGSIYDIGWSATDTFIAATVGYGGGIVKWRVESGVEETSPSLRAFNTIGSHVFEWSPDEKYIGYGGIVYGFAIFDAYTGKFFDFEWHRKYINGVNWSPDGNLLATDGESLMIWQINQKHHPHDTIDEFIGDLLYERTGGAGPSWHPDSSKIAYVVTVHPEQDPQDASDFAGSHAAIWDFASDTVVKLPGVFIRETYNTSDVIEWSPDGSKLASISSDGRIVIWDASTYEVVAEYAGYRSILDFYKDNP
jgi:WD40 repeat protein